MDVGKQRVDLGLTDKAFVVVGSKGLGQVIAGVLVAEGA